ncbi:MAG TPA: AAA family ATPase [Jatrophihabitantaceae bacterium]
MSPTASRYSRYLVTPAKSRVRLRHPARATVGTVADVLAGRDAERTRIVELLDAARDSSGGALVVHGVAGSGKSTLLAAAVAAASNMTVLHTQGVESESPLAFAALQRLLWPLRKSMETLAPPQRAALRAAFGEAEGEGDRFLVLLATLSVLAEAAEERPVVAVIDDAHWLDEASAAALLFVARRLQVERVALLFATRDGDTSGFDSGELPALSLGGLSGEAAGELLRSHTAGGVDDAVRDQLVSATAGNPLALTELSEVLSPDQLSGRDALPEQLPLSGGVERAFLDRYRKLPEAAQRFVLVAAADDTARLSVVRGAADRLDVGDDALDAVERAGLLRVDVHVVSFYHPLVRSAVYRAATSSQRRTAHRALAEALSGDADRRAWHLAAAIDRPDETVVAALDAVGDRAAARGGHEAAAEAWARAAELTVDQAARARRLFAAAQSSWLGGKPAQAAALARSADVDALDPALRTRVLLLRGQIEWNTTSLNGGYEFVVAAAKTARSVDEAMARQLAMLAASLSAWGARSTGDIDPAALVPPVPTDASTNVLVVAHLLAGFKAVTAADWAAAAEAFRQAFGLVDGQDVHDHLVQPNLGIAAVHVDDDARGLRLHEDQLTAARRSGALSMVEHALTRGYHFQLATGAWSAAGTAAAEALTLTTSTGQTGLTALPNAQLAVMAALRGDTSAAERHLTQAAATREAHPTGIVDVLVADFLHWTRGLLAAPKPASAVQHLDQITAPAMRRLAAVDRIETAVRAGRVDLARAWQAEIQDFADGTGLESAVAAAAHGAALLAEPADADRHFARALQAHHQSPRLPNRARTELAYGEHLRRARRRVDARHHLRSALTLFEELGATPYAERAAQELRASGETARRRDVSTTTNLTPQERQVAALIRQGLSNRDAAAQLFLSPRTVDFHLRNVFSKLGVTSRAELAALQLD